MRMLRIPLPLRRHKDRGDREGAQGAGGGGGLQGLRRVRLHVLQAGSQDESFYGRAVQRTDCRGFGRGGRLSGYSVAS